MARYGLLTDIHGNEEALDAALAELGRRGVSRILCMGDLVGYNAGSNEVVETLTARGAVCIAGNHDLIAIGELDTSRCWFGAAYALERTRRTITRRTRDALAALPHEARVDERVLLVHGDLGDPQKYVRGAHEIAHSAARIRVERPGIGLVLYGHIHDPRVVRVKADGSTERLEGEGEMNIAAADGDVVYVNPGSIDAQRKPLQRRAAQLAVLDTDRWTIELLEVPYAHAITEAKARAAGYRPSASDNFVHDTKRWMGRARRVVDRVIAAAWW